MRFAACVLLIALSGCHAAKPAEAATASAGEAPTAGEGRAGAPLFQRGAEPAELSPIPEARQPLPGVVTGGAPSAEQLRAAQALGYQTVISLLPSQERDEGAPEAVEQLGMRFVSIPIAGADDLTEENARELGRVLRSAERPLILHCASGNRSGALLALAAFYVEGVSAESALELGLRAGLTSLRPAVEARLGLERAEK